MWPYFLMGIRKRRCSLNGNKETVRFNSTVKVSGSRIDIVGNEIQYNVLYGRKKKSMAESGSELYRPSDRRLSAK
jgi:hypothetical protein